MCDVNGVVKKQGMITQRYSAWSVLVSFSSLFWFNNPQLYFRQLLGSVSKTKKELQESENLCLLNM